MKPPGLDLILDALRAMPAWLREHAAKIPREESRRKPANGGFSLLENVWHLADFERDGFGARIGRVLAERDPHLPDFDGEAVAAKRRYLELDLEQGLSTFESARAENLSRLEGVPAEKWARTATQEGCGSTTLADLPVRTAEHDRSHREEIERLLAEIRAAGHLS
jgi:hypothetical protein